MSDPRGHRLPSLGPRGEGWVAIQAGLGIVIAACGLLSPGWARGGPRAALGTLLMAAGTATVLAASAILGRSLTAMPRPRDDAALREHGVYRFVRHPIYGGVVVLALGWSLVTAPIALVPTAALAVFFDVKARREEAWLLDHYPGYAAYRERVRWRFVPFVR